MKAYGSKRGEQVECPCGCCTRRWHKSYPYRAVYDKARRKTARQQGKKDSQFQEQVVDD